MRVAAIYHVLNELDNYPPLARSDLPCLTLGAVCVYMLNAVMSRPSDWRAERTLRDTCTIHLPENVDLDDDSLDDDLFDNLHPSPEQQGLYFLADIVRDARHYWIRFPAVRHPEIAQLCILYHAASMAEIENLMGATGISHTQQPANLHRISNRRAHTLSIQFVNPDAIIPHTFNLDMTSVRLRTRLHMTGPDVQDLSDEDEDEDEDFPRDGSGSILPDALLDRIWAQFPYDLIQVSPNLKHRRDPPYTVLSAVQQSQVTLDLFKRPIFPFRKVWYRVRDAKFWNHTQFDRYFPPKGAQLSNLQNFTACLYFQDWMRLMSRVSDRDAKVIRLKIQEKFKEILWLPHTETSRIWDTRQPLATQSAHKWQYLSSEDILSTGPAPRISIRTTPGQKHTFTLGIAIPEEEEEEAPPAIEDLRSPPSRSVTHHDRSRSPSHAPSFHGLFRAPSVQVGADRRVRSGTPVDGVQLLPKRPVSQFMDRTFEEFGEFVVDLTSEGEMEGQSGQTSHFQQPGMWFLHIIVNSYTHDLLCY